MHDWLWDSLQHWTEWLHLTFLLTMTLIWLARKLCNGNPQRRRAKWVPSIKKNKKKKKVHFTNKAKTAFGRVWGLEKAKQAKITYDTIIQTQVFSFLLLAVALSRLVQHLGIVVNMSFSVLFSSLSLYISSQMSFPGGASGKEPACKCRRHKRCSVPGSRRLPWGGHGYPLEYFCLENPMNRGTWQAIPHRVSESQTWLKRLSMHE